MKRFIAAVALLLGLLLVVFVRPRSGPSSLRPTASLSFVRYTNDISGARIAVFSITNNYTRQIAWAYAPPEFETPEGWPDRKIVGGPTYGGANFLMAAQSATFETPQPSGTQAWRVPVICGRVRTRAEGFLDVIARRPLIPMNRNNDTYSLAGPEMQP